ncbi:hypothetical protein BDB13_5879 [Rhodococcus sp. OK302]|nr:hypothetical protein BDB13_5879 [Rhodococcus sp. OK302]
MRFHHPRSPQVAARIGWFPCKRHIGSGTTARGTVSGQAHEVAYKYATNPDAANTCTARVPDRHRSDRNTTHHPKEPWQPTTTHHDAPKPTK